MEIVIHIFKKIFDISNLPDKAKKFIYIGIRISFISLLFSTLLMALYIDFKPSNSLFEISSLLIQDSSNFMVGLLIIGATFNRIIKDKNINIRK